MATRRCGAIATSTSWCAPTDTDAACDALAALGFRNADAFTPAQRAAFRRYSGQDIVFRDGVAVEPHWALAPRTLSLQVDHDALFARARDIELAGAAGALLRRRRPCHGAVPARIEGAMDAPAVDRRSRAYDRGQPGARLGGPAERAREQGCLRMVLVGLALAAALLDALPAAVERAIAEDREARALAEWAASRLFDPDRADPSIYTLTAFRLRMRERMADRLRYVARTVATPRDIHFSLLRLPDALFFLYTPLKLVHDYALLPVWMLGKRVRRSHRG